jgi:hypothetical protein
MPKLKPLAWVIPWGLLAGLLLTLALLGSMAWKSQPGCTQTGAGPQLAHPLAGCYTIVEGAPERFLSSYPSLERDTGHTTNTANLTLGSVPIINRGNLVKDWLFWSLVSCPVLYVLALIFGAGRQPRTVPDGGHARSPAYPSSRRP